jgi:hypothetical protein
MRVLTLLVAVYVVTHEVGHTLGFQHNMKASSTYPLEKVRDKEWVRTMGHVPTLMDYSRFNYVAQPEDGIPPKDLVPRVGPYDKWATMWGYKADPGCYDRRRREEDARRVGAGRGRHALVPLLDRRQRRFRPRRADGGGR